MTLAEPRPSVTASSATHEPTITFERHPDSYRHWRVEFDAPIARLQLAVDPAGGMIGEYELKMNSYDIGVDIELADAVRRIRFEHPEICVVVIDSALEGIFCAGANIRMLAGASHAHKVNFCKFTNETRLEIEEASAKSGLKFVAAINGSCSGGGYELAMACDHLVLLDDRSTSVSLPEVPLLGVLPGTGGLTRLTDKRGVRRDRADVFATKAEGVQGDEALDWRLVDELAPPSSFEANVNDRAMELSKLSDRDPSTQPVQLLPLERTVTDDLITYRYVNARLDRAGRCVHLDIASSAEDDWPLRCARELDDLLCHLRFNEPLLGTVVITTSGDSADVLYHDGSLAEPVGHAQRETSLLWSRVLSRLDLTARTLVATIEPGSCFVGILAELALAADRTYMLDGIFEDDENPLPAARIRLTAVNTGPMPMANNLTRIRSRLYLNEDLVAAVHDAIGDDLDAATASDLGLVTFTPDDLDWHDEVRLAVEERASFSPDALTGMEANHRFSGPETMATKIFARLSAWQNWIFIRPNASGPAGALRRYGTGSRGD
ncbi:MAG: 2,3-epoxybenzoyl-CoA dihydrolase, partial [Acidimicrobiia bacterium]|nr:2,3-epoxybenzoyl-CoA dihydrolase [Acidimicrobiia bacterium]